MKRTWTILVGAGLLYLLITIILMMKEESLYNNLNWTNLLDYYKYWMVLGLLLLVGLMITGSLQIRKLRQQYRHIDQEHAAVKARLYDIEQERIQEDEQAGRRIQAFRQSLDKGHRPVGERPVEGRPEGPNAPEA